MSDQRNQANTDASVNSLSSRSTPDGTAGSGKNETELPASNNHEEAGTADQGRQNWWEQEGMFYQATDKEKVSGFPHFQAFKQDTTFRTKEGKVVTIQKHNWWRPGRPLLDEFSQESYNVEDLKLLKPPTGVSSHTNAAQD